MLSLFYFYINRHFKGQNIGNILVTGGYAVRRLLRILAISLFMLHCLPVSAVHHQPEPDELSSGYITIIDDQSHIITQTGLAVHPKDQYINEDNDCYEITSVEGNLASAYLMEKASMIDFYKPVQALPATNAVIAIYHTHTDESYIPTDGAATKTGAGSILMVGDVFAQRLTSLGYQVYHNKTLHEPHDANAYQRSRRTFMSLLKNNPNAIFDIHRDSAPLNIYQTSINGQSAAKILLVVGRQNQNRQTTLNYAQTIKAAADAKYKGLVRGIFIGQGNYNQDLDPRTILLEVGTQYNTRETAERSIALFADVVPDFLSTGNSQPTAPVPAPEEIDTETSVNGDYGFDILAIVAATAAGIAAYLYLSTGNWQEIRQKLTWLKNREFKDLWLFRKKNRR